MRAKSRGTSVFANFRRLLEWGGGATGIGAPCAGNTKSLSQNLRVRLASAGPSGGRTQGGRMAAPFGRPRTPPREVWPVPPDVRGGFETGSKPNPARITPPPSTRSDRMPGRKGREAAGAGEMPARGLPSAAGAQGSPRPNRWHNATAENSECAAKRTRRWLYATKTFAQNTLHKVRTAATSPDAKRSEMSPLFKTSVQPDAITALFLASSCIAKRCNCGRAERPGASSQGLPIRCGSGRAERPGADAQGPPNLPIDPAQGQPPPRPSCRNLGGCRCGDAPSHLRRLSGAHSPRRPLRHLQRRHRPPRPAPPRPRPDLGQRLGQVRTPPGTTPPPAAPDRDRPQP